MPGQGREDSGRVFREAAGAERSLGMPEGRVAGGGVGDEKSHKKPWNKPLDNLRFGVFLDLFFPEFELQDGVFQAGAASWFAPRSRPFRSIPFSPKQAKFGAREERSKASAPLWICHKPGAVGWLRTDFP